jgi:hypothetical protein
MALIMKNKAFALLSIVVAAIILDVSVFSVSAFENMTTEEKKLCIPSSGGSVEEALEISAYSNHELI